MNLSVPRVTQRRKGAQRNHNTWDLQKRILNATPYNDILENCAFNTSWWGFFVFQHENARYIKKWFTEWPTQNPNINTFGKNWNLIYALVSERKQNPCIHVVEILSQKNILSSFTHSHDVPNLWNTKDISKNVSAIFVNTSQWASKILNTKKDIKVRWNWSILL